MYVYYVHIHWSKKGTKSQATEVGISGILEDRNNFWEKCAEDAGSVVADGLLCRSWVLRACHPSEQSMPRFGVRPQICLPVI